MKVHVPETTADVIRLLSDFGEDTKVMAGGTALMIMLRSGLLDIGHLIALERLSEMRSMSTSTSAIRLGALVTLGQLAMSTDIAQGFPALAAALRHVANHRVRNRATVGGNLAESDYASDPPAILTAYGCRVRLQSQENERWIPIGQFLTGYYDTALRLGEVLTDVEIERPPPGSSEVYLKYSSRSGEDRPCLGVMAVVDTDERKVIRHLRVVIAAATPTPFMLADISKGLIGSTLDDRTIADIGRAYGEQIRPIDDVRGSAQYRKLITESLTIRALRQARAGIRGAIKL